jgi:outer membrane murein-binding lipoprotein Lpp
MNTDEKILKALAELRADVSTVKDVQQQQGKHLEALQTDVKGLHGKVDGLEQDVKSLHGKVDGLEQKVDTVEFKVEAINAYQKQAHAEIMEHLIESNEVNGQAQ